MPYGNKLLYLAIIVGVSGLLLSPLASRQGQQPAEKNQETPPPAITVNSTLSQNLVIQRKLDRMAQLDDAIYSRDEAAIQTALAGIEDCAECLRRIAKFLSDPSQQPVDKIAVGKALMQSATQAETFLLVNAILNAHLTNETELKEGLLGALGDAQTPDSAAALIAVITEGISDRSFHQLPDDLQLAIQNAIRLNPFPEAIGQMLATHYNNQASPEVGKDLENLQQPVMFSVLAKQAYDGGDVARTDHLTHLLSTMDNPHTLDGLMLLGANNVMTIDETKEKAYAWVSDHAGAFDQDHYAAYLSNFATNATQRSVVAFALAASQDTASAFAVLEKASSQETDPLVRSNLESAINLLLKRSEATPTPEVLT